MPAQSPDLAVLVGNGLSIAFNSDLGLDVLTRDVIERIKKQYPAEGEEVATTCGPPARNPHGSTANCAQKTAHTPEPCGEHGH